MIGRMIQFARDHLVEESRRYCCRKICPKVCLPGGSDMHPGYPDSRRSNTQINAGCREHNMGHTSLTSTHLGPTLYPNPRPCASEPSAVAGNVRPVSRGSRCCSSLRIRILSGSPPAADGPRREVDSATHQHDHAKRQRLTLMRKQGHAHEQQADGQIHPTHREG